MFLLAQELNLLNVNHLLVSGTITLEPAQYVNQYLAWHKKFGTAQNILGPVEGRNYF